MNVLKNTNTDISKEIFISPNQVYLEDIQLDELEEDYLFEETESNFDNNEQF